MIITRMTRSKFNANNLRSYQLNDKTIENLQEVIRLYDRTKKQRLIVKELSAESKKKLNGEADFLLEFVEEMGL